MIVDTYYLYFYRKVDYGKIEIKKSPGGKVDESRIRAENGFQFYSLIVCNFIFIES